VLEKGYGNKDIGKQLFICENTVNVHLRNVRAKPGASTRSQAISMARRTGLLARESFADARSSPQRRPVRHCRCSAWHEPMAALRASIRQPSRRE
jgi:hypothetical protein